MIAKTIMYKPKTKRTPIPAKKRLPSWVPRVVRVWAHRQLLNLIDTLADYDDRLKKSEITYIERKFDPESIRDEVFELYHHVRHYSGVVPTTLYVGDEYYAKLMHEIRSDMRCNFGLVDFNIRDEHRKYVGFDVTIIPWMEGMILL